MPLVAIILPHIPSIVYGFEGWNLAGGFGGLCVSGPHASGHHHCGTWNVYGNPRV